MPVSEYTDPGDFFHAKALSNPKSELWLPIFKYLRFGEVHEATPHVVVRVRAATPELLYVCEDLRPITCQHLLWVGEMRGKNPRMLTTGGYRSVLRLMWAWYYAEPPPTWAQIVHAPCQPFARAIPEVEGYGCDGRGGELLYEDRWRKCVFPWCLRVEPLQKNLYAPELQEESLRYNRIIERDIFVSRRLHETG